MADEKEVLSTNNLFPPELVNDIYTKVRGQSIISQLANQKPLAFNGTETFVFNMEDEIMIVGENQPKERGAVSLSTITIRPVKVEYGFRVSDEFMNASEEQRVDILAAFNDGFAKRLAEGFDLMCMHGVNPRSGEVSDQISSYFVKDIENRVDYDASKPDEVYQDALYKIENQDITGWAVSKTMTSDLGKMKSTTGNLLYEDFAFSGCPDSFYGVTVRNSTSVNKYNDLQGIVGDFANAFRWGYAKTIPTRIIEYGDPDNSGQDLQGANQIYIRAEAYLGWGIIDPDAFCKIGGAVVEPTSLKATATASAKASK